jgi:Protein of unknown function DUF262
MDINSITNDSDGQVGSEDEYDIALADGVDDDALKESPGSRKFTITSYGADYTVDGLVKRMRGGAFKIPDFQRRFVWSQKHASRFIESLLMGLPIPSIFLYKEAETNKHLVIDGQQRLKSLQGYYDGVFSEKKFRLQGVRDPWEGKTYDELDPADQLKIDDSIVHATIFQQDHPADRTDSIYYVFERINSGGIRLSPQEIRNCISAGPFTDLVKDLNTNSNWRKLFGGIENKRAKDQELIVRFFAMLRDGNDYAKPMAKFLNDASDRYNKLSENELKEWARIFSLTTMIIDQALNGKAFRPSRVLNAAVFDSVMTAVANKLQSDPEFSPDDLASKYAQLLLNSEYMRVCERGTSDEESVKTRRKIASEVFAFV